MLIRFSTYGCVSLRGIWLVMPYSASVSPSTKVCLFIYLSLVSTAPTKQALSQSQAGTMKNDLAHLREFRLGFNG